MMSVRRAMSVVCLGCALGVGSGAQAEPFGDQLVQPPSIGQPQRGSVAGTLSRLALGPSDLARGGFSLPLPIEMPSERGPLLAQVIASYSSESGISEWGMGWQTDLAIRRYRDRGEVDFATDDFTSPWGRLIATDDGGYVPAGLKSVVRVTAVGGGWTAETGDGTRYEFLAADAVTTARGTYQWMLSRVRRSWGTRRRCSGRGTRVDGRF